MADSEFATTASLQTVVDESSLRTAEQTIAGRLGDITVSVDAPAPAADGGAASQSLGAAGGTGPSITGGTTASEPEGVADILTALLEVEEAALEELEDIADSGGGLFGEGGIVGTLVETGGGLAGEAVGVSAEAIGNTVGPAVGTAVGSALSDLAAGSGTGPISVTKPPWVPIQVSEPNWTPLEADAPETIGVEEPTLPVAQPTLSVEQPTLPVAQPTLSVEQPTLPVAQPTLAVEQPTLGVERPTLAVDAPESIPLSAPTGQSQQPTGQQGPDQSFADSVIEGVGKGTAAGAGLGVGLGFAGGPFAPVSVPLGGVAGGTIGGAIGGVAGGIDFLDERFQSRPRRGPPVQQQPAEVSITNRPQFDLTVELDRDRIRRIVEDAQRDNLRELEERIDDVEREVDRVRRSFGGTRGR